MNPIHSMLLMAGAFFIAKIGKLYVPRFAGTNFFLLALLALLAESVVLVIFANAFHK